MLDAYIIDRIRHERDSERQRGAVIPLHIEDPNQRTPEAREDQRKDDRDRGTIVVDYQL